METSQATPESNADIVAVNLVMNAMVGEINTPGESLAQLFEQMAAVSRNIGGDHRAANADWTDSVSELETDTDDEIKSLVNRQELAIGDTWAQRWMLMHLAKRLAEELESNCLDSPASTAIETVEYDDDGTVTTWKLRPK